MTRDEFWDILDAAQSDAAFDRAKLPGALRQRLDELDEGEILDFIRHFHDLRLDAFRHELWAAAHIAGGGASDQDFSDFRDWLITLGRDAHDAVLHDAQRLLDHTAPGDPDGGPFDPDIARVATDLYAELTGHPDLPGGALRPHPARPAGHPWQPEHLPKRFPKLWRAFNG